MLLKDFYRHVVTENDLFRSGWCLTHYGIMSQIVNENDYKVVAEVGIGYGTHAKYLLRTTSVDKFYLIDPMGTNDTTGYAARDFFARDVLSKEPETPGKNFDELYELIQQELSPWKEKTVFLRKPSVTVSESEIPDESLDCVFIDGDHSYSAVLADCSFWWKKIRPGGQMLGDDIWIDDVQRAVDDFSRDSCLPYDLLVNKRPGTNNYKVFRFLKHEDSPKTSNS